MPTSPETLLEYIKPGTDLIVPLAAGEPIGLLNAVESVAESLEDVRVHQMHVLQDRPYLDGRYGSKFRHVSYFLSHVTRPHYYAGGIDYVPTHFSDVPRLLARRDRPRIILAAASPPDRHGYFSLGTNADYVSAYLGQWPVFLEVNEHMPRTYGRHTIHKNQVLGWSEGSWALPAVPPVQPDDLDRAIAELIADRIPNRATLQIGIGAIPNAVLASLHDHKDLGIHTELFSDGLVDLVEAGAATGAYKSRWVNRSVTTFALGTQRLYDFLHENPSVEFLPVNVVNDARRIAMEPMMVSVNATVEVDLLGQAASETIQGRMYSGSGGQADFAKGAMYSEHGQGFLVTRSRTRDGSISKIVPRLSRGAVVTTLKNTVDKVVTEWGVAEIHGRSIEERAQSLINIAHPEFRDQLTREARHLGYIPNL